MTPQLTWRKAIDKVLGCASEPLHYKEITERIIAEGYRTSLGATPADSVNAHIAASIKHKGEESPYVRVAKGTFILRIGTGAVPSGTGASPHKETVSEESEDQREIISSFGMFWRKGDVEWKHTPKLLGMQQIGATPVDFCNQLGVYLLYDGREVLYVGRSTDRPLGRRLYEHTLDRMATRWDRFSWFGLLPVSEKGELGALPQSHYASKLIHAMEAVLIEALEPRQNRKRGDDMAAVEYIQKVDPQLEKKKLKSFLDQAIEKMR
jgi:hypothetical protein